MASDKKIESQVAGHGKASGMTLRLLVARTRLTGYERALIDKLFFQDRTTTSTADVKAHYVKSGFKPVDAIKPCFEKQLKETLPFAAAPRRYRVETFALMLGAFGLLLPGCVSGDLPTPLFFVLLLGGLLLAGLASIPGRVFRRHMEWGYRVGPVVPDCAVRRCRGRHRRHVVHTPTSGQRWHSQRLTVAGIAALGSCGDDRGHQRAAVAAAARGHHVFASS